MKGRTVCIVIAACMLSVSSKAEPVQPTIDLSVGQSETFSGDGEYQSIRPGAMDDRFSRSKPAGDSEVWLGYEDQSDVTDEYGVVREQPSKDPTSLTTP